MADRKVIIDMAAQAGEQISKMYYDDLDNKRFDRLAAYYTPESTFIWNGTMYKGGQNILQMINGLPQSLTHEIETVDAQPVPIAENNEPFGAVMVAITGKASVSKTSQHSFHHIFVIPMNQGTRHFIQSEIYRWTD